jgi:hypothetical protein
MLPKEANRNILCFPSDKNGCGFYRTLIPLGYMSGKYSWNVSNLFQFAFDLNLITTSNFIRFQRQCTDKQKECVAEYRKVIDGARTNGKIMYELDDIVHGIEPHNILAYQFYTKTRRQNVLDMMKMSNIVTFSTKFLKHFYEREYSINNSIVVHNTLPKFLWNPDKTIDKRPSGAKPTILWAGSASHVGPGGDMEFLIPLIEKTVDEFEWFFVGCMPPKLEHYKNNKIKFTEWASFWEYPAKMQSLKADIAIAPIKDSLFNYAKSDLKYLEYAAMNIPAVCSSIGNGIGPYDQAGCPNLVVNDIDSWYAGIKKLLNDEEHYYATIHKQHEYLDGRWLETQDTEELYSSVFS